MTPLGASSAVQIFSVAHLTLEQLFMQEAGCLDGRGCTFAFLAPPTMPSTLAQGWSQTQGRCSVNMGGMDVDVMSVLMTEVGFLSFPDTLNVSS